jgi:acetylornithine deacetylase/succinyl-diaminopimelate desuccinylase-like protein
MDRIRGQAAAQLMLTTTQREWFEQASAKVNATDLTQILIDLINIASPTGEEGNLARAVVSRLGAKCIDSQEQRIDERQSNVVGRLAGAGGRPSLLLYSPLDTVTVGTDTEDLPWAADRLHPEMLPTAVVHDGHVLGLGAQNPKGHAACVIAAFAAIAEARIPLRGTLQLGLGAGGMPTNARPNMRPGSGHGAGCTWMLQQAELPDYALIAKSGWAVSWEEVGLAWYEVKVPGTHTYVGSRHLLPYSNAIVRAGRVVEALEAWFPEWTQQNTSGLVAPQGVVSFIQAGWERMPAFTPAVCRFIIDLRLSPRTQIEEADAAISLKLGQIAGALGFPIECQRILQIAGTSTDPNSDIIQAAIDAWQEIEGRPHRPLTGMSGATDANILRSFGIPTARIGLPKVNLPDTDFQRGMNAVKVDDMVKLTHHLIHTAIAVCTA